MSNSIILPDDRISVYDLLKRIGDTLRELARIFSVQTEIDPMQTLNGVGMHPLHVEHILLAIVTLHKTRAPAVKACRVFAESLRGHETSLAVFVDPFVHPFFGLIIIERSIVELL